MKLNLSLRKGNASLKEDASKLAKFQLFIGSLGFSLPSFEGVALSLDSLQRIGGTMDTDECWSLVMSHYQHQVQPVQSTSDPDVDFATGYRTYHCTVLFRLCHKHTKPS